MPSIDQTCFDYLQINLNKPIWVHSCLCTWKSRDQGKPISQPVLIVSGLDNCRAICIIISSWPIICSLPKNISSLIHKEISNLLAFLFFYVLFKYMHLQMFFHCLATNLRGEAVWWRYWLLNKMMNFFWELSSIFQC